MRTVSTATTDAWKAAYKGGTTRPMIRATIEKLQVGLVNYDMTKVKQTSSGGVTRSLPRDTQGSFASAQFCWGNIPVELPNVAALKWSRGVDSDIASATLTLWNTEPLPLGTAPTDGYDFDMPGYFSPQRGATTASTTRWGQTTNGWQNLIAPDRVIRTFEGYGYDSSQPPSKDSHLYPSGVWLIDDVTFSATGMITVEMRDIGRMLMEHISFPPVVPQDEYPLNFDWYHSVKNPLKPVTTTGWFRPTYETSDVVYYNKAGYAGTGGGGVNGHYGRYAFDGDRSTYWMSLNNGITHGHAYVQGKFSSRPVGAIKIKPWNGSYRAFISVMSNGKWMGGHNVPTHDGDLDTNMDIPFVLHVQVRKNTETVVKLPRAFPNVTRIRVSLCHDGTYGGDGQHDGIYDIQVSGGVTHYVDGGTHIEGDVGDYTDVVKWFLAWGGFFWTKTVNTQLNRYTHSDGTQSVITPLASDPMFPQGAIWGDLERAGVAGKVTLTVDLFDKKPLMDCIAYIRDILGFNFWIDETGGAIWRSPNVWTVGNYLTPVSGGPNTGRTSTIIDIIDNETITDMSVKMSSRNVRERVFVGSSTGQYGGVASGIFNPITGPYETGMRRISGWTDQNFSTAAECQIMADLIVVRQMFSYRTNTITIPGNPAIQIDDQVRVYERTTAETYLHYVKGITSENDLTTGKWTYSLDSHWLGEQPFQKWVFDPKKLAKETQVYLRAIGKI